MSANNNQTNRNANRFFFATSENGEQTLGLQYGTTGGTPNLSTMAVTISGGQGNGVIVNTAPSFQATDYIFAEEGLGVYGSTYFTPSTLATSITGINLSTDRVAGSGIAAIESYAGNGAVGGFEFLSRGVDSALLSTSTDYMNTYITGLGNPGATAVVTKQGTMVVPLVQSAVVNSLQPVSGGGTGCFGIFDLSGTTTKNRWALGKFGVTPGGNAGSDLALFSYQDDGTFLGNPLTVRRSDGAMAIGNISSIQALGGGAAGGQVFPIVKDNTEYGVGVSVISPTLQVLFSTPVVNLNRNLQSMVNINFENSLSSGSASVNYKIGFSTSTAYTNIIQSSYVPGLGGSWTPSDVPGAATPMGYTNICCVLDPDGLDGSGSGNLYIAAQLSDPSAASDQIYVKKGAVTEATRYSLSYKTI